MMDVEVVSIRKIEGDGNLKAFVDLKIGGSLIAKGFAVMMGKNGIFVSMPRKPNRDGQWFDIVTTADEAFKKEIECVILDAYEQELEKAAA